MIFNYRENRMKKIENLTWKLTGDLPEHIENKLDEKDKIFLDDFLHLIHYLMQLFYQYHHLFL